MSDARAARFEELQTALGAVVRANVPGSTEPHVCVALPSFSVGESLLSHYADRIPALEHRYLLASLMLHRIDACQLVFVCSVAPPSEVVDYDVSFAAPALRRSVRERIRIFEVPDRSARSVAARCSTGPTCSTSSDVSSAAGPR